MRLDAGTRITSLRLTFGSGLAKGQGGTPACPAAAKKGREPTDGSRIQWGLAQD